MSDAEPPVLVDVEERIATITLHRPEARNALSRAVTFALWDAVAAAGEDPAVAVVILTGADPAFCAGVDLKEVSGEAPPSAAPRVPGEGPERSANGLYRFLPLIDKPIIGAVNGVAVTGGLEVALQCTFLVASERAKFADTHARLGVMPGGGMTVLMAQTIGLRRAIELSLTGNFLTAEEALAGRARQPRRAARAAAAVHPPVGRRHREQRRGQRPPAARSTIARSPTQRRSTRRTSSRGSWPRAGSRGRATWRLDEPTSRREAAG